MKKIIVSILATLYLCSSTGATVHLHYCMDKLVSWSLDEGKDKCPECGMKTNNGCCKDENKFVKNNADQKTAESFFQIIQLITAGTPASYTEIPSLSIPSVTEKNPISHAPPLNQGTPIYILNCIYRI